ncbi:hypothetical protein, conserved [Leishmania tarentolae]|uniref:Splicing factor YJU2 n=1 Tax=Leishmania tarentolae TaxID=5689 RepID=A0A640KM34_LEITA|nr:hypothetical protein, conserved [Leishmania tarentolae]
MSKINATYSSGYYIAPDVDFRKLEEQQRQEQRGKRKHGGADDGGDDNVKRQTFAIPFDLICEHCNRRIARGSHVYANRRATDTRYLDSIRIWELEILCRFCKGKYYLRTDPETPKDTGGYICAKGCKRVEGDFYSLNKQNQAAREEWEKAKAEAELNPLAALERENEAARELEERNRQIEEAVEERAGHDDGDLLTMLRSRPRRTDVRADALDDDNDEDADDSGKTDMVRSSAGAEPALSSLSSSLTAFPLPKAFALGGDGDEDRSVDEDVEDADERAFREFNEDMERRWRTLERQQRARQRQQEQQSTGSDATMPAEDELKRVLARYGGDHRATEEPMATTPVGVEEPSALQTPGSASCLTSMTTPAPAVAPKKSSLKENKFFINNDDDDDDIVHADPQGSLLTSLLGPRTPKAAFAGVTRAPGAASITTGATSSARAASRFVASAVASQPHPPPRKGSSSLLRRLADDVDDEDVVD